MRFSTEENLKSMWGGIKDPRTVRWKKREKLIRILGSLLAVYACVQVVLLLRIAQMGQAVLEDALDEPQFDVRGSNVVWAGLVRSTREIRPASWDLMVELSCLHQVPVHLLVGEDVSFGIEEYWRRQRKKQREGSISGLCASFIIQDENFVLQGKPIPNRVDRLVHLRDHLREIVRTMLDTTDATDGPAESLDDKYVILVDMDLFELPPKGQFLSRIQEDLYGMDVVCAGGKKKIIPGWEEYYDSFSTIISPDTWTHPIGARFLRSLFEGEDPRFVSSRFTRFPTLWSKIVQAASASENGLLRAKSCYGGATIYRASAYLTPQCRYNMDTAAFARYMGKEDKRICEHVIFHHCLHDTLEEMRMGIDPLFVTYSRGLSVFHNLYARGGW